MDRQREEDLTYTLNEPPDIDCGWSMSILYYSGHSFAQAAVYVCADIMCKAPRVTLNKPYKPLQVVKS